MGDFNLPRCSWTAVDGVLSADATASGAIRNSALRLQDCMGSLKCAQLVQYRNSSGNTLDLTFCSIPAFLCASVDPHAPSDRYHEPLVIDVNFDVATSPDSLPHSALISFNFKKANYSNINSSLVSTDWDDLFDGHQQDVDMVVGGFYRKLSEIIGCNVPLMGSFVAKFPNWMSAELRSAVSQKKLAHRTFKATGDGGALHDFRIFRTACKRLALRDYGRYIDNVEESLQSDPREFWKFANCKDGRSGYPDNMYFNDVAAHHGQDIVNLFADRFSSVFSAASLRDGFNGLSFDSQALSEILFVLEDVKLGLVGLKPSFAAGPDGIPSTFFINCAHNLAQPILYIMNLSLRTGTFPSAWKQAFVIPVYKKRGDKRGEC
ncbi:uncharacterized protein LOC131675341 [Phymastichus coffea]|uniref:uncharacterized protein LOC131675341 n=1 Tax=Phymastichus coffea TaxID=108790 RepID=UPI00273C7E50|nr:uncharacterized protein LOC131675341 [Phymastichus coffea]